MPEGLLPELRHRSTAGGCAAARAARPPSRTSALFAALPEPVLPALERPYNVLRDRHRRHRRRHGRRDPRHGRAPRGQGLLGARRDRASPRRTAPVDEPRAHRARARSDLRATRIAAGAADLVIGCDIVVATSPENLAEARAADARARREHATSRRPRTFASNPDLDLSAGRMEDALRAGARRRGLRTSSTRRSSRRRCCGDAICARTCSCSATRSSAAGCPSASRALERAIELNGRAVAMNRRAFALGPARRARPRGASRARRDAAAARGAGRRSARRSTRSSRAASAFLTAYQDARLRRALPRARRARRRRASARSAHGSRRARAARSRATTSSCWPTRTSTRSRGSTPTASFAAQLDARVRGRLQAVRSTSRRSSCPPASRRATPRPGACRSGASRRA